VGLAAAVPAFGGWYMDRPGDIHVWVTDMRQAPAARAAAARQLRELALSRHQKPNPEIFIHEGAFSWDQLSRWRDQLEAAIADLPELASLDINEKSNRLIISAAHAGHVAALRAKVARLGVPDGATIMIEEPCDPTMVTCEEPPPTEPDPCEVDPGSCGDDGEVPYAPDPSQSCSPDMSCSSGPIDWQETTLASRHSLVRGGIRTSYMKYFDEVAMCTLGFWVRLADGSLRMLTNSHCDDMQGGLGTYNTLGQPFMTTPIGTEVSDPAYASRCGWLKLRRCRNSDAALYVMNDASRSIGFGLIARPRQSAAYGQGPGTLEIDPSIPSLRIVREATPIEGQEVDKVGSTTGWTWSTVTDVCKTFYQSNSLGFYCQNRANYWNDMGDSGSPVFVWLGYDVALVGVHHSRGYAKFALNAYGGWYSPLSRIRMDLGNISVF